MTITPTALLSLPIITTGTESGTWGDVVDNGLTAYLDIAIAGGLNIAITTTDVTLTKTEGTSASTAITSTTAQYAILNISGAKTAARNLNLPISSKQYTINNSAATGGFLLTVRGVTPTTGVTLVDGEKAIVAWNGTDYVKIVSTVITTMTGVLPIANGGTNSTATATNGGVGYGTGSAHAYSAAGTSGQVLISAGAAAPTWSSGTGTGLVVRATSPTITGNDTTIEGLVVGLGGGLVSTNTAYGVSALNVNTTGANNTAIGFEALTLNVIGEDNTAVGQWALTTSTGSDNTAVGTRALTANIASGLTAVGTAALRWNSTGSQNTAVGTAAAALNEIGGYNTAVGYEALYNNIDGDYNTAVGTLALRANTSEAYNTALGYKALFANTGPSNTAVGAQALMANTAGYNTAVGSGSLEECTIGEFNIAIGPNALQSNLSGGYNTALGVDALQLRTISNYNVAIGSGALQVGVTGDFNVAVGLNALQNTTGNNNFCFGYDSGSSITTGSNNVVIGGYTGSVAPISATGSNYIVLSDGAANVRQAMDATSVQFLTGAVVEYAPAPATTISAVTTLTNAQILPQIVVTSGTSFILTMPTGTTLNTLVTWSGVDLGFDFSVINTASGTITMAVSTGVTFVGTLTVLTGISARFRIRRTAASTYIVYRIG